RNRESEPRPGRLAVSKESFEDAIARFGRNAGAVVADAQLRAAVARCASNRDRRTSVTQCVLEQIPDQLPQPPRVTIDDRGADLRLDRHTARGRTRSKLTDTVERDGGKVNGLANEQRRRRRARER